MTTEISIINTTSQYNDNHFISKAIQDKLDYFLENNKIPHIIFHGSSGTGKKTIVHHFINKIYNNDKHKIKTNVMFVNCAHGKGIKFIREEIKFFAKTNIQTNSGVLFKTIILLNADFLTIDAQSALRRCIELFSYNTRFFIIVENKHKLLNPILSRFCEIYVPEHVINNKVVNLHQLELNINLDLNSFDIKKEIFIHNHFSLLHNNHHSNRSTNEIVDMCSIFYENGISCLDLINYINNEKTVFFNEFDKTKILMKFYQLKPEYRNEKLLMLCILHFIFSL